MDYTFLFWMFNINVHVQHTQQSHGYVFIK